MARRPRVFVGSSSEHLSLAEAVKECLAETVEVHHWKDGDLDQPSEYTLDVLLDVIGSYEFGVFILSPSDVTISREVATPSPRDNVIFEMGMFAGRYGRHRTFFIVPIGSRTKLPSDLTGLIGGEYDGGVAPQDLVAALKPACIAIAKKIRQRLPILEKQESGVVGARLWPDYSDRIDELLHTSSELTLLFIHSRSWRDHHANGIRSFLSRGGTLSVLLPDPARPGLLQTIAGHFDDEHGIPGFVKDAFRYFSEQHDEFVEQITVNLFSLYPVYTLYDFGQRAIMAMYPNSRHRQAVPAFEVVKDSPFGKFLASDLAHVRAASRLCSSAELRALAEFGP